MRREGTKRQLKASFTVEATIVMAIIFFCLVTVIMFAYRVRDNIYKNYVLSEAAEKTAFTEEIWNHDVNETEIAADKAEKRLNTMGRFSGKRVMLSKNKTLATAVMEEDSFEACIADTENYMRFSSVAADFAGYLKGDRENEQGNK